MNELPREAREMLALAQDAHDPPDPGARDRVRRGVALTIAAGAGAAVASKAVASAAAGAAGSGALKGGLFATAGAKLLLASTVVVVASAAVVVPRVIEQRKAVPESHQAQVAHSKRPTRAARHEVVEPAVVAPVTAPAVEVAPEPEAVAAPEPVVLPEPAVAPVALPVEQQETHGAAPRVAHHPVRVKRVQPAQVQTQSTQQELAAETALLRRASDAIRNNQLDTARTLLSSHEQRFASGQLREERVGLSILVQCMAHERGAEKRARTFLSRAPDTLLAARIVSACELEKAP